MALLVASSSSAHIRWAGCGGGDGYCEAFFGYTDDGNGPVDPINIVWWPYGWYEVSVLHWELGWQDECNSDQWNWRIVGTVNQYWDWGIQNVTRASAGCEANGRWHARAFRGHEHYSNPGDSNNWSISDAHHESFFWHDIDMSWQEAENHVRAHLNDYWGHPTTANWTYLPHAAGCWPQGGGCYNGWPAQIMAIW